LIYSGPATVGAGVVVGLGVLAMGDGVDGVDGEYGVDGINEVDEVHGGRQFEVIALRFSTEGCRGRSSARGSISTCS